MCARLREIALDCGKLRSLCGLFFLNQRQAVKTQEVLVWQISARDGKMRSICPKHIRTRKQPEISARLKIKVDVEYMFSIDLELPVSICSAWAEILPLQVVLPEVFFPPEGVLAQVFYDIH